MKKKILTLQMVIICGICLVTTRTLSIYCTDILEIKIFLIFRKRHYICLQYCSEQSKQGVNSDEQLPKITKSTPALVKYIVYIS